ncbi:MAG: aminopeptidase P family protein [Elusimicrobiota bacterium]|jgi:Xaa-Pro aminopeptidase|nr:aminopeptidase P family protein [Elusimicrobiota bacterium]
MPKLDAAKLVAVRKLLKKNQVDGYIISDFLDTKYIMGNAFIVPDEATLLIHQKGLYIVARTLYQAPIAAAYPEVKIEGADEHREVKIIAAAKKLGLKKVAFDSEKEFYSKGKAYVKAGFKEIPSLIGQIRVVKTDTEIKTMATAAKILYKAVKHIEKFLKVGVSEMEICQELESFCKLQGSTGVPFETIVAFGPNTGNPHHSTGNTKLKKNMPITMDFGCIYKNYAGDITRNIWFGGKPDAEYAKIHRIVKAAHDAVVEKARPGMTGKQIDAIARDYITKAGYGEYFTHRTGHGIGLQDHEAADISQINNGKILENYCFSVEPGIYLNNKFGARFEDCFYMTKNGPKRLG